MARPTFSLSDSEARQLITELVAIEQRCPFVQRDHRDFVREFIRAVHRVTSNTYSPSIYRRLLTAYAPARRPSTATLALEKESFVRELARMPVSADAVAGAATDRETLVTELRQILGDLIGRPASRGPASGDTYLQAQCDFLQQRLSHAEKLLAESKAGAAHLDARRQVLEVEARQAREQVETLRASSAALNDQLANLTRAIDDARQFALLAIDEARGETRAWKERCLAAEGQVKAQVSLTETFRRLAYRQGADIPAALEGKRT